VLDSAVDSSLAASYLELQFHTTDYEDQHVKVMRLQNARGKQKKRISDKFYLQVLVTCLRCKPLTVYFCPIDNVRGFVVEEIIEFVISAITVER
jgi:hypothetical protein